MDISTAIQTFTDVSLSFVKSAEKTTKIEGSDYAMDKLRARGLLNLFKSEVNQPMREALLGPMDAHNAVHGTSTFDYIGRDKGAAPAYDIPAFQATLQKMGTKTKAVYAHYCGKYGQYEVNALAHKQSFFVKIVSVLDKKASAQETEVTSALYSQFAVMITAFRDLDRSFGGIEKCEIDQAQADSIRESIGRFAINIGIALM